MKKTFALIAMMACVSNLQAQFSGKGLGTENDPYQITNADELFAMRNDLTACYRLMNDIDLTEWIQEENPQQGWIPVGTATTPFSGRLDGNQKRISGLYINLPGAQYAGLFGYTQGATLYDLELMAPQVKGGETVGALAGWTVRTTIIRNAIVCPAVSGQQYAGAVVGYTMMGTGGYSVANNTVAGGSISGSTVGGVVGMIDIEPVYENKYASRAPAGVSTSSYSYTVSGNYSSATIHAGNVAGGITGSAGGFYFYGGNGEGTGFAKPIITDNRYEGHIDGLQVGGIVGQMTTGYYAYMSFGRFVAGEWKVVTGKPYYELARNLAGGSLEGNNVHGIMYALTAGAGDSQFVNNVCCADTLSATEAIPCRISAVANENNYASTTTTVQFGGRTVNVESNAANGSNYGPRTLKMRSTYEGMGFNFSSQWTIVEGKTFPYNILQSPQPTVQSFICGSRATISGTAPATGRVYVMLGGVLSEAAVIGKEWQSTLGNVGNGSIATVCAQAEGMMPSVLVNAVADDAPEPPATAGDGDGDGVVDAADVVAIINYLLGKPSGSFVEKNADVNSDGQVLIDDAVNTVQQIMNAQ